MANWNGTPNWTDFSDINGGQKFEKILSAEDLNALAENIAYLYEHQGENEYLGDYVDGNYRVGAIVKYSDGNIYMCIKDTDDEQEPTNATYWQMLNEEVESEGEVLPDYTDSDFTLHYNVGEGTGELDIVYSSTEKVSFEAAPEGAVIDTLQDQNFVPSNIKKGTEIFGVTGEYEGTTDSAIPIEVSSEIEMNALLSSGTVGGVYKYTGTTGTYENGALYVLEEEIGVSITLSAEDGGGNNGEDAFVKFGTPPTSQDDRDYYSDYGDLYDNTDTEIGNNVSVKVQPIAYIWISGTDSMAGYKLNNGSLINVGVGYANATEVQLSEGDTLTLVSTWVD